MGATFAFRADANNPNRKFLWTRSDGLVRSSHMFFDAVFRSYDEGRYKR